ncbi:MAG: MBL fold metallo-hydrolase [Candidatus Firestonebacteria bacterium]|nr:MBL fold metallo-hydrolase [Candidatus Firestonebacteria bacterium]
MIYSLKKIILYCSVLFLNFIPIIHAENISDKLIKVKKIMDNITFTGNAGFRIKYNNIVISIDPFELKGSSIKSDIILITHPHFDHLDIESLNEIRSSSSKIVATIDSSKMISGSVHIIEPGTKVSIKGIEIMAVPAYNINKNNHPKINGWVGYIIKLGDIIVYHTGDTDFIPEMNDIYADLVLLPVGGVATMDAKEAFEAFKAIRPVLAIPMHYGAVFGTIENAKEFEKLAGKKSVIILDKKN